MLPRSLLRRTLFLLKFMSRNHAAPIERNTLYEIDTTWDKVNSVPISQVLTKAHQGRSQTNYASLILSEEAEFLVDVEIEGSIYKLLVDTGSSDTWIAQSDFQCLDRRGNEISQADCSFGKTYPGSFEQNNDGTLKIRYGGNSTAKGYFGKLNLTIAGTTVQDATIALVNETHWNGDGVYSGILGLGFGTLTERYIDGVGVDYDPIFQRMYQQDLVSKEMFSLALNRNTGGYMAFGGLPPVEYDESSWAKVPIQRRLIEHKLPKYDRYWIEVDDVVYKDRNETVTKLAKPEMYLVDSGNTQLELPLQTAHDINSLFEPPAAPNGSSVQCNAIAPNISLSIGGKTFAIDPEDMIQRKMEGGCFSGVAPASIRRNREFLIVGNVFLRNVLAVFDLGDGVIKFANQIN
jgi:Eukaryotic aspartyl protease